jgi:hypothetical protein
MASSWIGSGSFGLVELRGLEPLTPCLQSDVFACVSGSDLHSRLSVRDRHVPLRTGVNGTLMARDLGLGRRRQRVASTAPSPGELAAPRPTLLPSPCLPGPDSCRTR